MFRTFDADGDMKLDFREFMTAINLSQKAGPDEQLKWAFEMYDLDGSGEITMYECSRMIKVNSQATTSLLSIPLVVTKIAHLLF